MLCVHRTVSCTGHIFILQHNHVLKTELVEISVQLFVVGPFVLFEIVPFLSYMSRC